MASAFSGKAMIDLYRKILRVHKRVLPQEMKKLGDAYVRNEFKLHKTAKIGQVKQFAQQWKEYLISIELQAQRGRVGRDIDERKLKVMNEDQQANLRKLEQEAKKIGQQEDGKE